MDGGEELTTSWLQNPTSRSVGLCRWARCLAFGRRCHSKKVLSAFDGPRGVGGNKKKYITATTTTTALSISEDGREISHPNASQNFSLISSLASSSRLQYPRSNSDLPGKVVMMVQLIYPPGSKPSGP